MLILRTFILCCTDAEGRRAVSETRRTAESTHPGREAASRLGTLGLWTAELSRADARTARATVRQLEDSGVPTVWISEGATSKEILSHAAILLSAADELCIGTGIANIYARDAQAMANGALTLGDAFPGRFLLGLGVSHAPRVEQRGGAWQSPLGTMAAYLDAMDAAPCAAPGPLVAVPRLIGALGPRMSELATARTAGVLPFFVPVEHVRRTRALLGPDALIAVEQMVVFDTDPATARRRAREHTQHYLALDNYRRNLLRLDFEESDLVGGGSDRLVDEIVAWGDQSAIADRIARLMDAGADHVCLQVLDADLPEIVVRMADIVSA